MRIVWIDDQPSTIRGTEDALRFDGHEVTVLTDPAAARAMLRAGPPIDLLVVDEWLDSHRLRDESGSDLIVELKEGKLGSENVAIPFAVATADPSWIDVAGVRDRFGFLGTVDKSAALTPALRAMASRLVSVPGLVGPDGRSLARESEAADALTIAFKKVSAAALSELAIRPQLMQQMKPRDFEKLIAHLFDQDGFDVTLTPASGDRGVDIFAARRTGLGALLYVVECKRFRGDRPVKPALVRELRGVVDRENANCGVLVTTSHFSAGAYEEQRTSPHRLALRDLQHIMSWLRGEPIIGLV